MDGSGGTGHSCLWKYHLCSGDMLLIVGAIPGDTPCTPTTLLQHLGTTGSVGVALQMMHVRISRTVEGLKARTFPWIVCSTIWLAKGR